MQVVENVKLHDVISTFKYGSSLYSETLNVLFIVYAALLPFSNAFAVHTGPFILLLFWILEGNLKNKFAKIKSQKAIWFLLSFFVFTMLSLLWTEDIKSGLHYLKYYFVVTVVILTIFTSLKKQYAIPVLFTFFISIFVTEISLYGWYLDIWHLQGTTGIKPLGHMNRIMYSIFLAMTSFLLLWQLLNKQNAVWLRIIGTVLFISTVFTLFVGYGRTGQLAFLLAFTVFSFIYWKEKKRYFIIAFLLLITLLFTAYSFSKPFKERIQTTVMEIQQINNDYLKGSLAIRLVAKVVAINAIKAQPFVGSGIGDFNNDFHQSAMSDEMKSYKFTNHLAHPHDQFLIIALQTGIVGLMCFIVFLWFLFSTKTKGNLNKAILSSLLTVFIVMFISDFVLQNYISGLFGFVVGYFLNSTSEI